MTKQEIIEELSQLKKQFDKAFEMVNTSNSKSELKATSEVYSELKTYVVEYSNTLEKRQRKAQLNDLESSILLPAISEVALNFHARKNSSNKAELSSSLYDGSSYLSYYLSQLNS